jgi:hypothetical protein
MRYHRAWAVGLLVAAVVFGCGPAKELPDETPVSTDRGHDPGSGPESVPAKSDPAAVEIVDRAVKAHTQNNPGLLAKGKVSRMTAGGNVKLPAGMVPTRRGFAARWPDHVKWSYDFNPPGPGNLTLILRGAFTWWGENGVQNANLNPQKIREDLLADGYGLHWLVLLFPLKESDTVVYGLHKGAGEGTPPADVVRVSIPGRPTYRLHVAPSTGFLTKIEYHYTDLLGVPALTEWVLSDHKSYDGFLLPGQMRMIRTTERPKHRDEVQDWTVDRWEFPEKLDEADFNPPK